MTNINAEEIGQIRIPVPPVSRQSEFVEAMDRARQQRKEKLAESEFLLSHMDDILEGTLQLTPMAEDSRRVFAVRQSEIANRQLGASLYSPQLQNFFRMLMSSRFPVYRLADYVEVNPQITMDGFDAERRAFHLFLWMPFQTGQLAR